MSERLKNTDQVSNDEVVDDITKNINSSLHTKEVGDFCVVNPGSSTEDLDKAGGDGPESTVEKDSEAMKSSGRATPVKPEEDEGTDDSEIDEEANKTDRRWIMMDEAEKKFHREGCEEIRIGANALLKKGEYERARQIYSVGILRCPVEFYKDRSMLYCNRAAAKIKLGKYPQALKDCNKSILLDDTYIKAYFRRAQVHELMDKLDCALDDYKKVVEMDPTQVEAKQAVERVRPILAEQNEKLRGEMLGKLRELGNVLLRPFGLSTDNFQMEEDPETKGYKINFKQLD